MCLSHRVFLVLGLLCVLVFFWWFGLMPLFGVRFVLGVGDADGGAYLFCFSLILAWC